MILALYLAQRFTRALLGVIAAFGAILFAVELVEQIRRLRSGAGLSTAAQLAALRVPDLLHTILPLLFLLGGIVFFLGLARSSELVVIRATGRSALRVLRAPLAVTAMLGLLAVAALDPVAAASTRRYDALAARLAPGGGQATLSLGEDGIWLRQGAQVSEGSALPADAFGPGASEGAQVVIHAPRANAGAGTLYDATFLVFGPEGGPKDGPVRRIEAGRAELQPGAWQLWGVKDWPLGSSGNPERDAVLREGLRLPTDLSPDRLRSGIGTPQSVPVWRLPAQIAELTQAGFSARRHQVWLQMELALPAVLAAMVLIAAGFTMRHARSGGTGRMVLLAFGAGLGVFFLRNVAQVLGESGQIPVALAAWAPPAIALMLALALLLHLEDG